MQRTEGHHRVARWARIDSNITLDLAHRAEITIHVNLTARTYCVTVAAASASAAGITIVSFIASSCTQPSSLSADAVVRTLTRVVCPLAPRVSLLRVVPTAKGASVAAAAPGSSGCAMTRRSMPVLEPDPPAGDPLTHASTY